MTDSDPWESESPWLRSVVFCFPLTRKIGKPPHGVTTLSCFVPTFSSLLPGPRMAANHRHSNLLHIIGNIGRNGMESHTNSQVIVSLIVPTFDTAHKRRGLIKSWPGKTFKLHLLLTEKGHLVVSWKFYYVVEPFGVRWYQLLKYQLSGDVNHRSILILFASKRVWKMFPGHFCLCVLELLTFVS